ncbi:MAG: hypothetical protein RMJ55_12500 [Roseiflexaceae bacterium]|nr:hypothetical protein [Roseiflexaceae bacterium]MDW8392419.1 hypothetical protein [Oscillochloridaceae bacterium]
MNLERRGWLAQALGERPILRLALIITLCAGIWTYVSQPTVTIIQATPTPPPVQLAPWRGPLLWRAVVCYAAPAGDVLGAVNAGLRYETLERSGEWVLLRIESVGGFDGAGGCWVKAADLPGVLDSVPTSPAPANEPIPTPEPAGVPAPVEAPPASQPFDRRSAPPAERPTVPITPAPTIWVPGMRTDTASTLPPGADPLQGCVDGCRVFVTPAPEGGTP